MAVQTAADGTLLDGVMLGRAPYDTPYMLAEVDRLFFGDTAQLPQRAAVAAAYITYAVKTVAGGVRPHHVLRHLVGLFHGCANARAWRQAVSRIGQNGTDPQELVGIARRLDEQQALAA